MKKILLIVILSLFLLAGCSQTVPEKDIQIPNETIIPENNIQEETIQKEVIEQPNEIKIEDIEQQRLDEIVNDKEGLVEDSRLKIEIYKFPFEVDGFNFNIKFYNSKTAIKYMEYEIEPTIEDLQNSEEFFVTFGEYQGTDSGEVVRTSARVFPTLRNVLKFDLDTLEHILPESKKSCKDSTLSSKVIRFDPYSDRNGVFYNKENGCIEFLTDDAKKMGGLGDKFFYTIFTK